MSTVLVPEIVSPPPGLIAYDGRYVGRQELRSIPTPPSTRTHVPIPHADVVEALIETLGFHHFSVVNDGYVLAKEGRRLFGVLELDAGDGGVRFCVGIRNSHDKAFALSVACGYRVMVCANLAFDGAFVTARKHSASLNVREVLSVAIDQCHRNFEPMMRRVNVWQDFQLTDDQAKLIIYAAFVERAGIELPRHLAPVVHEAYFMPEHDAFRPRTMWSVENAFSEALKRLDPAPQIEAAAQIVPFLQRFSA